MRRQFGKGSAATIIETTHEQHVDASIGRRGVSTIEGTPPSCSRSTKLPMPERLDTLFADVQGQQATPAGIDGESKPRRSRLLGVHTHAGGSAALQLLARRA